MCKECVEIDEKMERYGLLATRVSDQCLLEGLNGLIDALGAVKGALHHAHAAMGQSGSRHGAPPRYLPH